VRVQGVFTLRAWQTTGAALLLLMFIDFRLPLDEPWRFLLSHGTCTRLQQKAYGGHGLDYVLLEVVPYLQAHGASDQQIEEILVRNPARLLTFPAILN